MGCLRTFSGEPADSVPAGRLLILRAVLRYCSVKKQNGLEVVDLAKDPNAGGPLARSTTPNLKLDKSLSAGLLL
jgi:hypothetical protein